MITNMNAIENERDIKNKFNKIYELSDKIKIKNEKTEIRKVEIYGNRDIVKQKTK